MCKQACVQRIRGWFLESREQRGCQNEFRPSAVGRPPCEEVNMGLLGIFGQENIFTREYGTTRSQV